MAKSREHDSHDYPWKWRLVSAAAFVVLITCLVIWESSKKWHKNFVARDTPPQHLAGPDDSASSKQSTKDSPILAAGAEQNRSLYPGNDRLALAHVALNAKGELYLPNDRAMAFSKNFTFPDGETISIEFRVVERFQQPLDASLDDGTSPGFFNKLSDAARAGDDQAAIHAYREVAKCISGNGSRMYKASNDTEVMDQSSSSSSERCDGIDEATMDDALELLRASASRGNPAVEEFYARLIAKTDFDEARKYFKSLWAKGFSWGAGGLSVTGKPPFAVNYDAQVETEAYSYVSYAISMSYYDGVPLDYVWQHMTEISNSQLARQKGLSPAVHSASVQLAKEMLIANNKCCISYVFEPSYINH